MKTLLALLLLAGAAAADPTNGIYPTTYSMDSPTSCGTTIWITSKTVWASYVLPAYTKELWIGAQGSGSSNTWVNVVLNINGPYTSSASLGSALVYGRAGLCLQGTVSSLGPIEIHAGPTGATLWSISCGLTLDTMAWWSVGAP